MNLGEERKAFEVIFKPDEGVKWSEENQWYYVEDDCWEEGLRETSNYFRGWLAAKEPAQQAIEFALYGYATPSGKLYASGMDALQNGEQSWVKVYVNKEDLK